MEEVITGAASVDFRYQRGRPWRSKRFGASRRDGLRAWERPDRVRESYAPLKAIDLTRRDEEERECSENDKKNIPFHAHHHLA